MEFGNVQRFEIVIRRFDFRAFRDGKADGDENVFDFLKDLANQVTRTDGTNNSGKRKIGAFTSGRCGLRNEFCGDAELFDFGFDVRAQFIQGRADNAF